MLEGLRIEYYTGEVTPGEPKHFYKVIKDSTNEVICTIFGSNEAAAELNVIQAFKLVGHFLEQPALYQQVHEFLQKAE